MISPPRRDRVHVDSDDVGLGVELGGLNSPGSRARAASKCQLNCLMRTVTRTSPDFQNIARLAQGCRGQLVVQKCGDSVVHSIESERDV